MIGAILAGFMYKLWRKNQ